MTLASAFQPLTADSISRELCTRYLGRHLHVLETCDSTNRVAFGMGQAGAPDGTVVVADTQTAGRGRAGRTWHSPPGRNLYCSVLLRTAMPSDEGALWLGWIPLLTAVATARAVHVLTGLRPALKWPNDLLLNERKVGGILCESTGVGKPDGFVVAGIGLNVNGRADSFPPDIRDTATSLAVAMGRPVSRTTCLAALLNEMELRREQWMAEGADTVRREYLLHCATIGQRVRVDLSATEAIEGVAVGIAADGALEIHPDHPRSAGASPFLIRAGDVTHVRPIPSC